MQSHDSCTDEQLITDAQKGNKEAYNTLLTRYSTKLTHLISFNVIDQSQVHDISQEVLLKVYRYLPHFKLESQFSTWLYRITKNTIKNHYRMTTLRLESETEFAYQQNHNSNESPEYQASSIELGKQVEEAIAQLSQELRDCYGLHTFEGQSYEEIAKEMNCPIGTVRSRIYRARKLLSDSVNNNK